MSKGIPVLTFVIGAFLGSAVTYKLVKDKFQAISDDEIESVKEMYEDKFKELEEEKSSDDEDEEPVEEKAKKAQEKPNIMDYTSEMKKNGYISYSTPDNQGFDGSKLTEPEVIPPDEYGEYDEYDKINLTYYADGTLADENDEVVSDVDATIGSNSLETFGEWEDDSVHVRNDNRKAYYEILRDERTYDEVLAERPHPSDFNE